MTATKTETPSVPIKSYMLTYRNRKTKLRWLQAFTDERQHSLSESAIPISDDEKRIALAFVAQNLLQPLTPIQGTSEFLIFYFFLF
jgi:hypothetical protein